MSKQSTKKIAVITVLIIIISIVSLAFLSSDRTMATKSRPSTTGTIPIEKTTYHTDLITYKDYDFPTSTVQQVQNVRFKDLGGGLGEVSGEVNNQDSISHGSVVSFIFINSTGEILGTASAGVAEILPRQSQNISALVTYDVSGYKTIKTKVSDR